MIAHKANRNDSDEYPAAETTILDDDCVMSTGEFRKLVALDPDLFDEIGPPELED